MIVKYKVMTYSRVANYGQGKTLDQYLEEHINRMAGLGWVLAHIVYMAEERGMFGKDSAIMCVFKDS